jgi:subtilisin-like proprotein convertase family protein
MARASRIRTSVTLALVGVLAAAGTADAALAAADLDEKATDQIAALQEIKLSLPAERRKLDSRLAVALRQQESRFATAGAPLATTGVRVSPSGTTEVDIRADRVGDDLLDRLKAAGAITRYASRRVDSVRASIPLAALDEVASWQDVRRVDLAAGATAWQEADPVVTEGDAVHAADRARARRRVSGTGAKVCVLSDGVSSLAESQAAGELPAVDVLPEQAGGGDEGVAMLEIIHDMAPKAELGFATAFRSDASFADNIRALRFNAGCDVIVDDVLYFNEHPFQDGPIARSVDAVTADGALYFSSAGNAGNTLDGTSATYEGDFVDSGRGILRFAGAAHDFDPGPGVQTFEPISPPSSAGIPVTLFWADPLGAASDDYDLYLLDAASNVVAFSQNVQDGDDDPFEILGTPFAGGPSLRLAVVRFRGESRYFQLSALGSRFSDSADGLVARVTPGALRGHVAAAGAFGVAAVPAAQPFGRALELGDPPNPAGPFPNPYTPEQLPERFTSDGPRRVFFHPDGTPITPGDFSSTGGAVRQKPDIAAADGVSTSLGPFSPFFGTSASAAHAAAIAGLVVSGNPGTDTADVREAFDETALDVVPAGVDERTGQGIVRADRVLALTGATPQPLVRAGAPVVTPVTGDGDAFLEPGETATLDLPLTNDGDGRASGVQAAVNMDDPTATVTPRARSYGALRSGETRTRPFEVALAPEHPLGKRIHPDIRVRFDGRLSPTTAEATVGTGEPAGTTTVFAYAGDPAMIPDNSPAGASVPIAVSGVGYASKLTFSIDGGPCTADPGDTRAGIDHTFVGDLVATLTAPGGASATLFARDGAGGNNLCEVVFDDAATRPFASVTLRDAPFTGTWRPDDPLEGLLEDPVDGTWTLRVVDTAPRDTGAIHAVGLHIAGFVR